MMRVRSRAIGLGFALLVAFVAPVGADAKEPDLSLARTLFVDGNTAAKAGKWGDALELFRRSSTLHPHPQTTYNIALCERALGRYVRARRSFEVALEGHDPKVGRVLPPEALADTHRFLAELAAVIAVVDVTLEPADTALALDGAPLELQPSTAKIPVYVAGTGKPGPGAPLLSGKARILLDPGAHVWVLSKRGYADVAQTRSVRPGERAAITFALDRLPAELSIRSNVARATVSLDGLDVGLVPIRLERPAGRYRVLVRHPGYVPYDAHALLRPGEQLDLEARLSPETPSIFTKWWFWTIAGAVLVSATVGTYFAVRGEPSRPEPSGGGLGWVVRVP